MYEIWLVLNIVWELALDAWPWLVAAATVWVALAITAVRTRAASPAEGLVPAIGLGAVVAVLGFLLVPGLVKSSMTELRYWVDWANLVAIAIGLGVAGVAFTWPVLRIVAGRRQAVGS